VCSGNHVRDPAQQGHRAKEKISSGIATGCSKRPTFSPARPRRAETRPVPGAAAYQSISGVAGMIPTARVITRCNLKSNGYPAHHPPHLLRGAGGWAGLHCARPPSTPSASARNESILSARCASTTGSPAAPPLFPVCATREHVRRPGHHTPALVCGVREQAEHPSHPVPLFQHPAYG